MPPQHGHLSVLKQLGSNIKSELIKYYFDNEQNCSKHAGKIKVEYCKKNLKIVTLVLLDAHHFELF